MSHCLDNELVLTACPPPRSHFELGGLKTKLEETAQSRPSASQEVLPFYEYKKETEGKKKYFNLICASCKVRCR